MLENNPDGFAGCFGLSSSDSLMFFHTYTKVLLKSATMMGSVVCRCYSYLVCERSTQESRILTNYESH
ncbi:hypothetical protein MTR67_025225 [Solanum verrucosum]|uniref:Uncharacterized protein n=1 Tax=Solanum verrucosum TaxID=315347 RepID=A0AAF0TYR0_SOLVR|nr:hypothetical protein MTR67_025225 [Solanum verrucosum]